MDLYFQILELGLDARTWVDYIVQQTRNSMQHEPTGMELADIAMGVQRLGEKVERLKELLGDYITPPAAMGARKYPTIEAAYQAFISDDGYPNETLLGKYYIVGTTEEGYDIQFLTPELYQRIRSMQSYWQIMELKK